jgi:hypothetical protein
MPSRILFLFGSGGPHISDLHQKVTTPETFICRRNSRTFFGMPVRPVATFLAQRTPFHSPMIPSQGSKAIWSLTPSFAFHF